VLGVGHFELLHKLLHSERFQTMRTKEVRA
jgi:hypothetical protein